MKIIFKSFIVSVFAAAVFVTGAIKPTFAAPEFTFKFHHLLGPKSPAHSKMIMPWVERVEKASKGRIKIDVYPSMSLGGKPPQLIRQLRDGVVDMIWTVNGYTAGQFPRSEVFELPFIHTNNLVATNLAMYEMFNEYLAEEYKSVHPLVLHVHAGQGFQMVDKAIRKVEDVEGLKIRIPTRTGAWILEALGANPVGMPVPELPQALSKKVVDGALIPWEIIAPLKIHELTQYQIEGVNRTRFGTTTFQISMNKNSYNSLPADLKKVIDDLSGIEFAKEVGRIWTNSEVGGINLAVKSGNEHIEIGEDELKRFRAKLEPVVERWISEVEKKGIDGRKLVDAARTAIAKYSNEM
ncbi:MAG: TRAP transporter substrate-binding protein [SAR324 cluster bacterium]|nr:TRAP transporter substrate-binding protein [SAR324 cluster bacterium]